MNTIANRNFERLADTFFVKAQRTSVIERSVI
jgi:hypothetical protein